MHLLQRGEVEGRLHVLTVLAETEGVQLALGTETSGKTAGRERGGGGYWVRVR